MIGNRVEWVYRPKLSVFSSVNPRLPFVTYPFALIGFSSGPFSDLSLLLLSIDTK
jgi:hypothetical protein